jgi:hypothetical protein
MHGEFDYKLRRGTLSEELPGDLLYLYDQTSKLLTHAQEQWNNHAQLRKQLPKLSTGVAECM